MPDLRPIAKKYTNPSYRRSDHPSFEEKKHTLIIDSQGASNKSIETESGTLRFENGMAVLPDDERGRDMYDEVTKTHALHPNQYALVEDKPTVHVDPIHNYTFGSHPPMPWASYDERGRRVEDPEEEQNEREDVRSGDSTDERPGSRTV